METPGKVAIVGRPNVGKSALFNRLVGRNIAIVHDQPGITRDRLVAISTRGKRPLAVWDTGGIGGAGEGELPQQVRMAADAAMRESDLVLFVVDAQQGLTPIDADLGRMLRRSRKPVVLVINKIDDPKHETLADDFAELNFDGSVSISAAHGRGISDLLEEIERMLPLTPGGADSSSAAEEATTEPTAIAIVGKPNAGKSSLINAVLRDERTIVSAIPGTTRDAVDVPYTRSGERFVLIDTAGIRARGKHSSSVEVFSVMRAERTIRRADLCVLVVDLTSGVTGQDKKIAGLIQKAQKACVVVLNKWDLIKPQNRVRSAMQEIAAQAQEQIFFLPYAPVLVTSAIRGENVLQVFTLIDTIRRGAARGISTGPLNRLLRSAFAAAPPPIVGTRRLKLFYATQANTKGGHPLNPVKFVLFVNDPKLLTETYKRYLEGRIRAAEPYAGLPMQISCRARSQTL
ncbi:MAG: ribosome biogenesis GTPase Der [Chthoniobacterales bacterium]